MKVPLGSYCRKSKSVKRNVKNELIAKLKSIQRCLPLHVDKDGCSPHVNKEIEYRQAVHIVVDYPDYTWIQRKRNKINVFRFSIPQLFHLLDPPAFSECPISHNLLNSNNHTIVKRMNAAINKRDTRIMLGLDRSTSHAS